MNLKVKILNHVILFNYFTNFYSSDAEIRTINAKAIKFDLISHQNLSESIIFLIQVYEPLTVIRQQVLLFL